MSPGPRRDTPAGRAYRDLQNKARREGRPTDELLQLYLERLSLSSWAGDLILKGGVLLAAYDTRRPTRDVDFAASNLSNDLDAVLSRVRGILSQPADNGWTYGEARAETIREEDEYSGVRVTVPATLTTARITFNVDVNVGDPIWPAPTSVEIPRLLGGSFTVRGYPLAMVLAEKIVTAVQRGSANTRWRDFADLYLLTRRHAVESDELAGSIARVSEHRHAAMSPLSVVLDGYPELAQNKWSAWIRRQHLAERLPLDFAELLNAVGEFADPGIKNEIPSRRWMPENSRWRSLSRNLSDGGNHG